MTTAKYFVFAVLLLAVVHWTTSLELHAEEKGFESLQKV
jgi:hypothetical protein